MEHFEIAIIGAGPAGIGAATNAAHHKLSHILFERREVANTIFDYQLRKHVMAEPSRLPLRAKCRFEAGSRESILEAFKEDLQAVGVNLKQADVGKITKTGDKFEIAYSGGTCTASHVILAIGVQGSPRKLGVPGEDSPHVAYTLADPDAFSDSDIFVVGAGDAAIENAIALSAKNRVFIVNRGGEFARAKDANSRLILGAIGAGKLKCYFNTTIAKVDPDTITLNTPDGEITTPCTHIIARLGCILPRPFLEATGIALPSKDPNSVPVVNGKYESNIERLYILGALIGYPLIKQAINQGFEVIEHIRGEPVLPADQPLLEERFENIPGGFTENFEKIKTNLPLFQSLSDPQMREMVIESSLHSKEIGEIVFERNDYTDTFWSVIEGEVQIEIGKGKFVTLKKGDFFGEMGLISGRRRTATVRAALQGTLLLETPRRQIIKLMSSVAEVKRTLDRVFVLRSLETSIFPGVPRDFLVELSKKSEMKSFKKGDFLFKEGDIGDSLYVIRKGSLKVSKKNSDGEDIAVTYIPVGNYVGEMSLLEAEDTPRNASVSAAVACETIKISKADFQQVLTTFPEIYDRVQKVSDSREIENITNDLDARSGVLLDFMVQQGITDAENVLLIDSDLCVACDNCEAACAATHGGYSRLDRKGGKSFAAIQIPISCRHCENPLCMLDCPPDALTRKPDGEVVIRDSCIGCGNCVANCPYGVIQLVYEKPKAFSLLTFFGLRKAEKGPAKAAKCDMCSELSGGPACVRACPTGAAMRVNPNKLKQIITEKQV